MNFSFLSFNFRPLSNIFSFSCMCLYVYEIFLLFYFNIASPQQQRSTRNFMLNILCGEENSFFVAFFFFTVRLNLSFPLRGCACVGEAACGYANFRTHVLVSEENPFHFGKIFTRNFLWRTIYHKFNKISSKCTLKFLIGP